MPNDQIVDRYYQAVAGWNEVGSVIAGEVKRLTLGCGKLTHVSGTNGGKMACGSELTWPDGKTTREYCGVCQPG